MVKTICLDKNYSTTQLLTHEKPILEEKTEEKFQTILSLPENEERKGEGGLRTKGYFKKSYDDKPLISIITVVFNGEKYLEQTIQSVLNQTYSNVEYIIVDGDSTDGTLDIIKKYEDQIDYWVSEKDNGIYDAMNKGVSLGTGDYIAFLNADDWYPIESIKWVVENAMKTKAGYIYGNINLYDGDVFMQIREPNLKKYKKYQPFGHQSLFVKINYMQQMPFDTRYNIAADYDFMIKLIVSEISYIQIKESLVNFRIRGISSEVDFAKEHFHIQYNHFGIITAIYGYLLATKQPIIAFLIKALVRMKHSGLKR